MKAHFRVGDSGELGGIQWRIVQGSKTENDFVLQIRCAEWTKPKMALSFLLADFHTQSEDLLVADGYFKRPAIGGQMFLNSVRNATQVGWQWASERLEEQRRRRRVA